MGFDADVERNVANLDVDVDVDVDLEVDVDVDLDVDVKVDVDVNVDVDVDGEVDDMQQEKALRGRRRMGMNPLPPACCMLLQFSLNVTERKRVAVT